MKGGEGIIIGNYSCLIVSSLHVTFYFYSFSLSLCFFLGFVANGNDGAQQQLMMIDSRNQKDNIVVGRYFSLIVSFFVVVVAVAVVAVVSSILRLFFLNPIGFL